MSAALEGAGAASAHPVTPDPVTPGPVTPGPVTPLPVTPGPVTLSPVTLSPVTLSPVTLSPVSGGAAYAKSFPPITASIGNCGQWLIELPGRTLTCSPEIYQIFGLDPASFRTDIDGLIRLYHPADRDIVRWHIAAAIRDATAFSYSLRIVRPDGELRYVLGLGVPRIGDNQAVDQVSGTLIDITEQKDVAFLRRDDRFPPGTGGAQGTTSEARLRVVADALEDLLVCFDGALDPIFVSAASRSMLGYLPEELQTLRLEGVCHAEDWPGLRLRLSAIQRHERAGAYEFRIRHKGGAYLWVEARASVDGDTGQIVAVCRDITVRKEAESTRREAARRLEQLAARDSITGLASHHRFSEALGAEWRRAQRSGASLSLMFVDLDHFRSFNERFGRDAGDACLRDVAGVTGAIARRGGDLTARYDSDQLAILLPGTGGASAVQLAEQTRAAIAGLRVAHPDNISGGGFVTASIGVAVIQPAPGLSAAMLMSAADARLREAKRVRDAVVGPPESRPVPVGDSEERRLLAVERYLPRPGALRAVALDRLAKLAADLMSRPIALITLVGRDQQVFVGNYGLEALEGTARGASFCAHTLQTNGPMVVPDASQDPRFADNPLVTGSPGIRFYAGVPLVSPSDGARIGALSVVDLVPGLINEPTRDSLFNDLATLAMGMLDTMSAERTR